MAPPLHEDLHVRTAPLYDATNFPGTNEDLTVEIPVSVATTDPSGHVTPATIYASFPVQIPDGPVQAPLPEEDEVLVVRKSPSLPELTSANPMKPFGRPQTPMPRETAVSEVSYLERPYAPVGRTSLVRCKGSS